MSADHTLPDRTMNEVPLFCDRCVRQLYPGDGDFYVVRIEALADPTPPSISVEDLRRDVREEIERLIEQMRDQTEQELMDQVYRRVTLFLCRPCYTQWIEHPAG